MLNILVVKVFCGLNFNWDENCENNWILFVVCLNSLISLVLVFREGWSVYKFCEDGKRCVWNWWVCENRL